MDNFLGRIIGEMFSKSPEIGSSTGEGDFVNLYNTSLPDDMRDGFMSWIEDESKRQGRNLLLDLGDYDVQGYWLAGERPDERGHGTDTYKKPNHPTFSNESVYHGLDGYYGGSWGNNEFVPGKTNLEFRTPEQLAEYFASVEPGVRLAQRTMIPR